MTGRVHSIVALRSSIRDQIGQAERQFGSHVKQYRCRTDTSGCIERAQFQAKLEVLRDILKQIGGRERSH
jgi:hypothetical protein